MNKINRLVLDKRAKVMKNSHKISKDAMRHSSKILNAPKEVKIRRSEIGCYTGSGLIAVGAITILAKASTLGKGLLLAGVCTVGVNLLIINKLKNKKELE